LRKFQLPAVDDFMHRASFVWRYQLPNRKLPNYQINRGTRGIVN
jgi:hypothetical protein